MKLAPVVLFVFNRPDHTRLTVDCLSKNELAVETDLIVYSDGPRNEDDILNIQQVRKIIQNIDGFKSINIVERPKNLGLSNNIYEGVTEVFKTYDKVIVLEDDLLTSPKFLEFMNNALDMYQGEPKVFGVTGYSFTDVSQIKSAYFLPFTSSWGWGTWKSKWQSFERNDEKLRLILAREDIRKKFDLDGAYDFSGMINQQLWKRINSWAIYWYAFVFEHDGLFLFPPQSYIKNIGFDGTGTHCSKEVDDTQILQKPSELPNIIEIDKYAFSLVKKNLVQKLSFKARLKSKIKSLLTNELRSRLGILYAKIMLLKLCRNVGKNTFISKTAQVIGWRFVRIGNNTLISDDCWLNVNERLDGFIHIDIGDNCYIGRRNMISSSRKSVIKDYVMTSSDCHFLASNHVFTEPLMPYIATGITSEADQVIGVNVWIGARVTVLGKVTIGHGSLIGAGSVVTKDIPPFSIAVGNPCKVIKRYSFKKEQWVLVSDYNEKEESFPSEEVYLKKLKENCPSIIMPKFAASRSFGDLA